MSGSRLGLYFPDTTNLNLTLDDYTKSKSSTMESQRLQAGTVSCKNEDHSLKLNLRINSN